MDFINTTTISPITTTTLAPGNDTLPSWTGFIFLIGSSILYGSNYLPVKAYDTGDGQFFQLLVCIGIWIVGFVLNIIRGFPKFYALPLIGGCLWSTGNNMVVPILQTIGIGLGMIFWNSIGLIVGWATGRFGWFGLKKEVPSNEILNYVGVALVLISTFFYLLVEKTEDAQKLEYENIPEETSEVTPEKTSDEIIDETTNLINSQTTANNYSIQNTQNQESDQGSFFEKLGTVQKKIVGVVLSILSGLVYGQAFTPIVYIRDNYADASKNSMDHLFSFYTGILVTSLLYFMIYCAVKKNKPVLNNEIALPGLVSGIMWGLANICYFNANNVLPQAITFPIANSGPMIVGSLWGVILYKEIKGLKNIAFLLCGFAVSLTGAILTGLSS